MSSTAVSRRHRHRCARCEHDWDCLQVKCQVAHAAKSNKAGPFCELCLHLIMAKRLAAQRQYTLPAILALLGNPTDVE